MFRQRSQLLQQAGGDYLSGDFWLYSVPEGRLVFQHEFDGAFVFEDGLRVFDQNTVLTYRWSEKNLTCWSLVEQMP